MPVAPTLGPSATTGASSTATGAALTAATSMPVAPTLGPSATTGASSTATGFIRTLPGLIYFQGPAFQHFSIHLFNCRFSFSFVRYFNESETV
jgi:hypothetical protein